MSTLNLDEPCSRHFRFRALIHCGATYKRLAASLDMVPHDAKSWEMLAGLAVHILDPLVEQYGGVELTYGFAPPALTRHIKGRIAPALDQHAACERRDHGALICEREGAAVDLKIPSQSMLDVAAWLARRVPVDRLYFYGAARPLHVSWHPQPKRSFLQMQPGPSGHLIPRRLQLPQR